MTTRKTPHTTRRPAALVALTMAATAALLGSAGCDQFGRADQSLNCCGSGFSVAAVKLQPTFTKIGVFDRTMGKAPGTTESAKAEPADKAERSTLIAGSRPAGIVDAYVGLRDQFQDPLKALGRFRFELFRYRSAHSDPRGERFDQGGVQEIDLTAVEENQRHWDNITQCYHFQLSLHEMPRKSGKIVLEVTFMLPENDYRLQDMLVLQMQ